MTVASFSACVSATPFDASSTAAACSSNAAQQPWIGAEELLQVGAAEGRKVAHAASGETWASQAAKPGIAARLPRNLKPIQLRKLTLGRH
jgi:hypothetical protein